MPDIALFAVTNRTGSTLLQRIFNANPDTLIWGENGRVLMRLVGLQGNALNFSRSMAKTRERYFAGERPIDLDISCMSPKEGVINSAVVEGTRAMLASLYPSELGKRIGFKEVSHRPMAIDLFRKAFPSAECVFLARHPVSAWRSHPEEWPTQLDKFIETWRVNVEGYAMRGKLYWLEDLISSHETQEEIREIANVSRGEFDRVMATKVHSTAAKSKRPQADFERILAECSDLIPPHIADRVKLPASA